jgi:hypothetical protein
VKLQGSYPGTQQTGSFNVDGEAGVGPFHIVGPSVSGSPADVDALNVVNNGTFALGSTMTSWFGDPSTTAKRLGLRYRSPSSGGGQVASWTLYRADKTPGAGLIIMAKNASTPTALCVATDFASGSGYPVNCDSIIGGGVPFAVGQVGGAAGFTVQDNGNIQTISGNSFGPWIGMSGSANYVLSTDGSGHWQWTNPTTLGTGTVTSISTTVPVTGCSSPCTSTATIGLSATTTNDGGTVVKQASTPGTAQTGNANLTGTIIASTFVGALTGNATTATTASVANALATTGASVDVAGSAAPGGAGYACITTNATHCTWQLASTGGTVTSISTTAPITGCSSPCTTTATLGITSFATTAPSPGSVPDATSASAGTYLSKSGTWTIPAGSGGVTVAAKGDIQTYSSVPANLAVGADGLVVVAEAAQTTGLKYGLPAVNGKGVFTWGTASRTSSTVYQNSGSFPMLVVVDFNSSGTGNVEILSDASNPPTTSRSKSSNSSGASSVGIAWVLPSHFYKIIATSGSLRTVNEYVFTKGTLTDSGDLSGSKAFATAYQNTSGKTRFVAIEVGTSGSATALSDAANPPTTTVMASGINSGVGTTLVFPVLDQHYYKVTQGGSASIVKWYEYDLSGVTVTRSASMTARALQVVSTPTKAYQNLSGRSLMIFFGGHGNGTGTLVLEGDPQLGFSTVSLPSTLISAPSGASGVIRGAYAAVNPGESYVLYYDTGASVGTNDAYTEITLE